MPMEIRALADDCALAVHAEAASIPVVAEVCLMNSRRVMEKMDLMLGRMIRKPTTGIDSDQLWRRCRKIR
jgi:hypothetical protein